MHVPMSRHWSNSCSGVLSRAVSKLQSKHQVWKLGGTSTNSHRTRQRNYIRSRRKLNFSRPHMRPKEAYEARPPLGDAGLYFFIQNTNLFNPSHNPCAPRNHNFSILNIICIKCSNGFLTNLFTN